MNEYEEIYLKLFLNGIILSLTFSFYRLNRLAEAIRTHSQVIRLDPFFVEGYLARGNAFADYCTPAGSNYAKCARESSESNLLDQRLLHASLTIVLYTYTRILAPVGVWVMCAAQARLRARASAAPAARTRAPELGAHAAGAGPLPARVEPLLLRAHRQPASAAFPSLLHTLLYYTDFRVYSSVQNTSNVHFAWHRASLTVLCPPSGVGSRVRGRVRGPRGGQPADAGAAGRVPGHERCRPPRSAQSSILEQSRRPRGGTVLQCSLLVRCTCSHLCSS